MNRERERSKRGKEITFKDEEREKERDREREREREREKERDRERPLIGVEVSSHRALTIMRGGRMLQFSIQLSSSLTFFSLSVSFCTAKYLRRSKLVLK